jgi:hypothetical protein
MLKERGEAPERYLLCDPIERTSKEQVSGDTYMQQCVRDVEKLRKAIAHVREEGVSWRSCQLAHFERGETTLSSSRSRQLQSGRS